MARVRRLLLTLASGSALYSGMVPALGLGEITLHSALNQPLDAEIELLEVGDLGPEDVKVRLASAEAFGNAEVERLFFLNDLRFIPIMQGSGSAIRVVSSKPVREPYLNFLVELARPNGSLLREYTLLIDPPGSAAYRTLAAPQPQFQSQTQPQALTSPAPVRAAPVPPPPALQGQRYSVVRGDSLWVIAKRLRAAGSQASLQALMEGIHALNPQAFVGGDINRLKVGESLLLPDMAAAAAPEPGTPAEAAPAEQPTVSTATSATAPGEQSPQQIAAIQRRVDAELAASAQTNQQLKTQMADLQRQLEQLQQQIGEKNRQLTALQTDLAQLKNAPSSAAPPVSVPQPAPIATGEPPAGSSRWLIGLAIGLFLLFLLPLGLIWWIRRATRKPVESPTELELRPLDYVAELVGLPEALAQQPPAEPTPAPIPAAETSMRVSSAPTDALEGAKIYIAYGRFSEALGVLRMAVGREPQRLDLRLRMLEVLAELGDGAAFAREEEVLRELGADEQKLEQIKARYPALGAASGVAASSSAVEAPTMDALEHATLVLDESSSSASDAVDESQMNLDDLSLDADWEALSPFEQPKPGRSKPTTVAPVAEEPSFSSNLEELPEIFELTEEFRSAFDEKPAAPQDEILTEEFLDVFGREPQTRTEKPLEADLNHLAVNREHLTELNMALAYIEQGDMQSACNILNHVLDEGDDEEKQEALALLARIA